MNSRLLLLPASWGQVLKLQLPGLLTPPDPIRLHLPTPTPRLPGLLPRVHLAGSSARQCSRHPWIQAVSWCRSWGTTGITHLWVLDSGPTGRADTWPDWRVPSQGRACVSRPGQGREAGSQRAWPACPESQHPGICVASRYSVINVKDSVTDQDRGHERKGKLCVLALLMAFFPCVNSGRHSPVWRWTRWVLWPALAGRVRPQAEVGLRLSRRRFGALGPSACLSGPNHR